MDDIGYNVLRKENRNAEYVNSNNNLLKWQEEANIDAKIDDWLMNTSGNKLLEAKVANKVREKTQVQGLGIGIKRSNNTPAGDLDVYTKNELIEVKEGSGSISYPQLDKYVNPSNDDYINPFEKKVIIYINTPMDDATRITVEANLPPLVSLANSYDELLALIN